MGIFIALQNLSNEQHPYSTIQSHKSMTSKRVLLYSAIQLHKSIIAVKWFCALKPYQFSKTSVFEASPMNPRIDFTVGNVSNFMPILATMFLALPL